MTNTLTILCFILGLAYMVLAFPEGFTALILILIISTIVVFVIKSQAGSDSEYLVQLFMIALLVRLLFGLIIHMTDSRGFFGADATTYDEFGNRLIEIWFDNVDPNLPGSKRALSMIGSGWGMIRLVGWIYTFTGRNILAAQSFCAVIGAATVPMIYSCSIKIFNNRRVGKISALIVALYPAFIIWTGQLLKDGLVIFLLVLSMTLVLRLQEKFKYSDALVLMLSLGCIITLRFYIFYMVGVAIVGAFVIGNSTSPKAIFRRLAVMAVIGLGLTYVGVFNTASSEFDKYGNLEILQTSRQDLAKTADSGYGKDLDISTTGGAITALPIGFLYLMLAPFPWQMTNFRQLVTLPEVLLWWSSIPFMISGILYTIRHRLRKAVPIIVFSLILTLAYSIFSGNVGTAYRQRTQIQVFLFIFIGVGWTIRKEKLENKLLKRKRGRNNFPGGLNRTNELNSKRLEN